MNKLNRIFTVIFFLITHYSLHAQNFRWAKPFGSTALDEGRGVVIDGSGNSYTTGMFQGTIDFDPNAGTFNLTSAGVEDVFILKLNSRGELVWVKQMGGTGSDKGLSIAMSNSGQLHVTGTFQSTVDFDPNAGTANLTSAGGTDIFITTLDTSGNFIWAKRFGGTSDDEGKSITVDAAGKIYATGFFQGTADFDPDAGTLNLVSAALKDIFFVKLNTSGALVWAKKIGGTDNDEGRDIAVDSLGNIYTIGIYWYTVDFDPGPGTFNLTGGQGVYINKLDSLGNFVWANGYSGSLFPGGNTLTIDPSGNIVAGGYFYQTMDFDAGPGTYNLTSPGVADLFLIKLDAAGSLIWVKQIGGATAGPEPRDVQVNASGQIFLTGYFNTTTDFDPSAGVFNLTALGQQDIFVASFDDAGNLIWASQLGGSGAEEGHSLAIDAAGNITTAGWFAGTTDFDPGAGTANLSAANSRDVFVVKLAQSAFYGIEGNVYADMNANCSSDSVDFGLPDFLVKIDPGPYYGSADRNGNFIIYFPDPGNYTVSVITNDTLWEPSCTTSYTVQVTSAGNIFSGNDFAMQAAFYCPRLSVDVGSNSLFRKCFDQNISVSYSNTGNVPVSNAFVQVEFPDQLQPQSSTIPWTTISGNTYTFPLGTITPGQEGIFVIVALLDCNAPFFSTQCVTAHIHPDTLCIPPPAGWDKSETAVTGACDNDSLVCFTIKNQSGAGSGDMGGAAQWRLYVNDTLVTQGSYQLAGQDSLVKCYPANGKTYRLEADQNPPHPGNSHPQAIVEACGTGNADFGFVNSAAQDDAGLAVETFCAQVRGSFDPNDKQVSPQGITANNYITANDELEYLIRFQNTGNDTAFKVVLRDTIATDVLDIATLTSGASSHDYTFTIYGQGIAEWTFDNILLPDSFVNEPASHGFVKFKINQLPGNPSGTRIENRVGIYFDFNDPVITNTAWNEVHEESSLPQSFLTAAVDSVTDITTCHGDSSGATSVSATGGLPPYQFTWSNGAIGASADNLFAGNYSLTVTDAAENVWTDSVTIAEPTLLETAITAKTDVLCFGDGTGTATATATGGTTPYTYEWSHQGSAFATATSLNAGVYSVTVWDAHLCTATASSVTINEPTQLTTLISTQSGVTCFGGNDATAKANPAGGVAPYTAEWSNGETDFTANDLSAGNYQVTVTDSNGCALTTSITIQDGYAINTGAIAGADSADINQSATYSVNAGFAYTWSVTNGTIVSGQGTNSVEVDWNTIGQGTLEVAVADSGCAQTVSKTIALIDPTGIRNDFLGGVELYPNPTSGTITLRVREIPSLGEMESLVLKLYDSIGKQVLQQTATPLEIQQGILLDLNEMNEGVFFLNIKTEAGTRVMKVVRY